MYPLRTHLIILRPRHEPLTNPLINHKNNLGRHLRAQEPRLLHPKLLPLGEIIRHLEHLDTRRRLRMARMLMGLRYLLLVVLLLLDLEVQWLLRLSGWGEVGV